VFKSQTVTVPAGGSIRRCTTCPALSRWASSRRR
jgi:hypothetical protein